MLIKKLLKEIFFWSIPFFVLVSLIFFVNIIKKDFIYGHYLFGTGKDPYNWLYDYTVTPFKKFYIRIKNDNKKYFPKISIYLSESKLNYFLTDIPNSVKEWQKGKIIHDYDEDNIRDVKIRLKGDNPANWMMEKKSFRIKLKKGEMHGRQRYYNYVPFEIRLLISTRMALNSKLLAPKVRPVELLMNDEKKGLYLEIENFNENFLRRNKIMPVNFYKGENYNQESKIALPRYLYSNSGLWSKEAYFNLYKKENKNDLKKFLEVLNSSKHDPKKFKILQSYLDEDYIGRYLAYIFLAQNYHTTRFHNNRIIIDPWKGQIFPVITDPGLDISTNSKFDHSANDLTSILNQNSKFIDLKYHYLKKFLFEEKIIDEEVVYLNQKKQDIINAMQKDPIFINITPEIFSKNKNYEIIESTIENLKNKKKTLISELRKIPNVFWSNTKKNFSIILNDTLPVSNIELTFDKEIPEWVFIDENYNYIYDDNEIKFFKNNDKIKLNVSLYSNRINSVNYFNLFTNNILTVATKFNFISSNESLPSKIEVDNIFLNDPVIVNYQEKEKIVASNAHNNNKVIFRKNKVNENYKMKILSGEILVQKDLIFENPVRIKEGTTFLIEEGVNIIFKNKVEAIGNNNNTIKFLAKSKKPWGTIAIIGKNTIGSKLKHLEIKDGSGSFSDQFYFTSMLSIHNTSDVELENIKFHNNYHFDDMLHIIYSSQINLKNLFFFEANGDAIDIDMCEKVSIENTNIYNSKNDGIDLMESDVLIKNVNVVSSKDKGISIGEASKASILKTKLEKNNIAIAIKDNSKTLMKRMDFINNDTQIAAYKKNFQYGSGGSAIVEDSFFKNSENKFYSRKSNIVITNAKLEGKIVKDGKNISIND